MHVTILALFAALISLTSPVVVRADTVTATEVVFPAADGRPLGGTLYQPDLSDGHLPGIVLQHDCFGIHNFQRQQARALAEMGYVALLVDSFSGRRISTTCTAAPGLELDDAVAAKSYLETVRNIDPDRIGLIGWAISTDIPEFTPFAAIIAIYPACPDRTGPVPDIPVLLLSGGKDNWTPPEPCLAHVNRLKDHSTPARIRIYPDAAHGFDNTGLGQPRTLSGIRLPSTQSTGNATIAYNRLAHEDARKRIEEFLGRHLQLTLARAYPSKAYSPLPLSEDRDETPIINIGRGTWVIDPTAVAANTPSVGRSVFDRLFTRTVRGKPEYAIPFPYTRLIAQLNARLAPGRSGGEPVKQVLFPMGRSLQREAAAPDYFANPRVVVAVDGEPDPAFTGEPILLKDRLFLGYVERTNVLEVISYNEAAERFEFQVVKNYAAGKTPEVFYADRRLCTTCHQNKSPLFPRENWNETNAAGGKVGQKLRDIATSFHGITVRRSGEVPAKIDLSTDRANLFSVLQKLWRDGCGKDDNPEAAYCRAAAFRAMIQFRLANTNDFDRGSGIYAGQFESVITRNWRRFWPGGLFIPNSDIPDRDPLGNASAITGSLDPLSKRGPMEIWSGFRRSDPERLITGLANQFTVADIQKLDVFLISKSGTAENQVLRTTCTVSFNPQRGLDHPLDLNCEDSSTDTLLEVEIALPGRTRTTGKLKQFEISGMALGDRVNLTGKPGQAMSFTLARQGLSARMPDGRRIASLAFLPLTSGGAPAERFSKETRKAEVEIKISNDFSVVTQTIARLAEQDDGMFAATPFHGPKIMSRLFGAMGIFRTIWCCAPDAPAPPLKVDTIRPMETASERIHANSLQLMSITCGACHRTDNPHPPNFLAGSPARVLSGIRACAPRILRRLALWDIPEIERDQTAMPPTNVLHARGLTAEMWRQSPEIRQIRQFVTTLVAESGRQVKGDLHRTCAEALQTVR